MKTILRAVLFTCIAGGFTIHDALAVTALNSLDERKSFVIERASSAPIIDGKLDDAAWENAAIVSDFHQTAPRDGATPTEPTIVRVLYDDNFLYIAAELNDSDPDLIRATQMIQGRTFYSDDRFWVTIDSFNSKRNDYFFQVNANGMRRDALRENNDRFIEEWAAIWYAESVTNDEGWATEIAIPFKSISFDPKSDTWGINFGRGIVRKQEFNMWSSYQRQDWPAYSGEVSGIENIQQGLGLDIMPSLVIRRLEDLDGDGESINEVQPSLDVRYRITPSLNAALTINTDFSTTEIDDQQVALDRFSLFFPEKRDFFLQDAGIFEFGNIDTNGRPFFSRRIGLGSNGEAIGLDAGLKLTGRQGRYSVGALAIRQEAVDDIEATDLLVARGSMNILDESAVGLIATHGDPVSNDENTVVGADFLYRNSDGIFGQIVQSQVWFQQSSTNGDAEDSQAYSLRFEMPNDRVTAYIGATEIQENFNPSLGFVNRTGIRRYDGGFRYRRRPDAGMWRTINHRIDASLVTDMDGQLLSQRTAFRPVTFFSNQGDFLMFEWQAIKENVRDGFTLLDRLDIPQGKYSFDRFRAEISTGSQRPINVVFSLQDGGFFGGTRFEKYAEFQWRQSQFFSMDIRYTENDIDLPSGSFISRVANLRADIAFSPKWSWSNVFQYDNSQERYAFNTRLRFIPVAGRELLMVVNYGEFTDYETQVEHAYGDATLKFLYTFRY